jgi:elongation factor P
MDKESFEQASIAKEMIGERAAFLQDGMTVVVESHEGRAISVRLPEHVTLEITETEPSIKGQSASGSYKPAKVDNGLRIMVPPFVTAGERIVVNTGTMEYVRRAD